MELIPWKGRLGPFNLNIGTHTFRPSTITTLLAEELQVNEGDVVIDVGSGSGILAILAAKL
ncbi:MAG: 50S ribosomal protein L11 methyltransferase, partial [Acidimicrobiia bacterium]|nr:50S ribosomal protein L11 methyltransferase [Acidimicrobiia bacterium]